MLRVHPSSFGRWSFGCFIALAVGTAATARALPKNPYRTRHGVYKVQKRTRYNNAQERWREQAREARERAEQAQRAEIQRNSPHLPTEARSGLSDIGKSLQGPPQPARPAVGSLAEKVVRQAQRLGLRAEHAFGRDFIEVRTGGSGVADYLREVGENTVEVIFNPHTSVHGHIMLRVGKRIYDLGNSGSAGDRDYVGKVGGYDRLVGAVFAVSQLKRDALQRLMTDWVAAINTYRLPVFDAYSRSVKLERTDSVGAFDAPGGTELWKVVDSPGGMFDAKGPVFATLQRQGDQAQLVTPTGTSFDVRELPDGRLGIAGLSCTSFPTVALQRVVPELGIRRSKDSRKLIEVLATWSDGPRPDFLTVYRKAALELPLGQLEALATDAPSAE